MRYLLTVAYDGTHYSGWQRQKNAVAIQDKMEWALDAVFKQRIPVTAASRTDAGVHALGQRVCFSIEDCRIPTNKIPLVLNSYLPDDISVIAIKTVDGNFNPRFMAKEKTYHYCIWHDKYPNPLIRLTTVFFPYQLNLELMKEAAKFFEGKHDFAAFCAAGSCVLTTIREIFECRLEYDGCLITIKIRGEGFLYNMVRIIAGTLIAAGQGKIPPADIQSIIKSRCRAQAGPTMPAHGLTLIDIKY